MISSLKSYTIDWMACFVSLEAKELAVIRKIEHSRCRFTGIFLNAGKGPVVWGGRGKNRSLKLNEQDTNHWRVWGCTYDNTKSCRGKCFILHTRKLIVKIIALFISSLPSTGGMQFNNCNVTSTPLPLEFLCLNMIHGILSHIHLTHHTHAAAVPFLITHELTVPFPDKYTCIPEPAFVPRTTYAWHP